MLVFRGKLFTAAIGTPKRPLKRFLCISKQGIIKLFGFSFGLVGGLTILFLILSARLCVSVQGCKLAPRQQVYRCKFPVQRIAPSRLRHVRVSQVFIAV